MWEDSEPKVFRQKVVTARKQHSCCECRRTIHVGTEYEYTFGVWDTPDSFKTCMECLELRKEFMCKMDEVDTQVVWVFTQLFATILEECSEYFKEDYDEFKLKITTLLRKDKE